MKTLAPMANQKRTSAGLACAPFPRGAEAAAIRPGRRTEPTDRAGFCEASLLRAGGKTPAELLAKRHGQRARMYQLLLGSFMFARRFQDVAHGIVAFVAGRLEHPIL